jgi:hypothetical protein
MMSRLATRSDRQSTTHYDLALRLSIFDPWMLNRALILFFHAPLMPEGY